MNIGVFGNVTSKTSDFRHREKCVFLKKIQFVKNTNNAIKTKQYKTIQIKQKMFVVPRFVGKRIGIKRTQKNWKNYTINRVKLRHFHWLSLIIFGGSDFSCKNTKNVF